jgi:hypothetical protein
MERSQVRLVQEGNQMSDWTWQDIEAYDDFMDSWANSFLCDQDAEKEGEQ